MNWRGHVTVDPEICHGKACITGTRVVGGYDPRQFDRRFGLRGDQKKRYPSINGESVQAVVFYAVEPGYSGR